MSGSGWWSMSCMSWGRSRGGRSWGCCCCGVRRGRGELRCVRAPGRGVRLGLHRLRLEGELTEIRGGDLRFSLAEAGELFAAAGVVLPEPALGMLYGRTEG